jgi:Protein of unknown function (DUF742)
MDGHGPRRRRRTTPVGRTGARFAPIEVLTDQQPAPAAEPVSPPVGARFGPYSAGRAVPEPEVAPPPEPEPARPEPRPAEPLPSESDVLIRPYARTGGRTRPTHDLALEAMITTAPCAQGRYLSREHRAIANLCVQPRSVAEVAALLTLPLGVARVLLADLATDGAIRVHRTSARPPDLVLMHRVLAGLRRL